MLYLSDENNLKYVLNVTDLSLDEVEAIVGRFKPDHHMWPGKLKGLFIEDWDGNMKIVHHFTRKVLWSNDNIT